MFTSIKKLFRVPFWTISRLLCSFELVGGVIKLNEGVFIVEGEVR